MPQVGRYGMNLIGLTGIVMIAAGAFFLAYGGFTTTEREKLIDVGPLQLEADVEKRHNVPPAAAWGLLGSVCSYSSSA